MIAHRHLTEVDDNLALSTSSFGSEISSTLSPLYTRGSRRKRTIDSDTDSSSNPRSTHSTCSSKRMATIVPIEF